MFITRASVPAQAKLMFKVRPCKDLLVYALNQALVTCCHQSGLEGPSNAWKRVLSSCVDIVCDIVYIYIYIISYMISYTNTVQRRTIS